MSLKNGGPFAYETLGKKLFGPLTMIIFQRGFFRPIILVFISKLKSVEQKGLIFDHDLGYSFPFFSSLLKKGREVERIAKIVIKKKAFYLFWFNWIQVMIDTILCFFLYFNINYAYCRPFIFPEVNDGHIRSPLYLKIPFL